MTASMEISLQNPQDTQMSEQNGDVLEPALSPPTLPQEKFLVSGQYELFPILLILHLASQFHCTHFKFLYR